MIKAAEYKSLNEWKKLGYIPKKETKKPFCWLGSKKIPQYERYQMERISL